VIGTDKAAFAIGEEMVEVPGDRAAVGGALEIRVDGVHVRSVHAQFLIERDLVESVGELLGDEVLDGVLVAGLLSEELVAREEQDFEVGPLEFLLELEEVSILREGFASRRRDVHSEHHLVAEAPKIIDLLGGQPEAAQVVETRRNGGEVVASMRQLHHSASHVAKKRSQDCRTK